MSADGARPTAVWLCSATFENSLVFEAKEVGHTKYVHED